MRRPRFDPYRALSELGVDFYVDHIDPDLMGFYDHARREVRVARGLTQTERRCTVAHEYVHARRGDVLTATEWHECKQEQAVARAAARLLIPLDELVDALRWSDDLGEVADELWVDVDTLRTRLGDLEPGERGYLGVGRRGEVASSSLA